ncbi:hypothetical protein CRG98_025129 [Punica granatum]|uniref:Uncharacterized protein n=1 Tax=Punica granatum TaxID=22663 RepID=A0A2I0JE04_PUNGR|nr:hypothetical protein CRG98_025129 [Punica granatum]
MLSLEINMRQCLSVDPRQFALLSGGPEDRVLGHEPREVGALQLGGAQLEVDEVEVAGVVKGLEEVGELHEVASGGRDELLAWCIISLFLIVVLFFAAVRPHLELLAVPRYCCLMPFFPFSARYCAALHRAKLLEYLLDDTNGEARPVDGRRDENTVCGVDIDITKVEEAIKDLTLDVSEEDDDSEGLSDDDDDEPADDDDGEGSYGSYSDGSWKSGLEDADV